MFVISITYKKELSEVDKHIKNHVAYLEKYYEKGNFIASGRKVPRTGGVILAKASSKKELEGILKEDPFNVANVANYEVIEFSPTMAGEGFEVFKNII